MGVGAKIKDLLKEKDKTILWLAEKSGVSKNTLYAITKRDTETIRGDNLKKIADALEVTPQYLLGIERLDESYVGFLTGDEDIERLLDIANGNSNEKPQNIAQQGFVDMIKKFNEDRKRESQEQLILIPYRKLNDAGKQKVIEYTTDLAQMEKYQRNPDTKK